MKKINKVMSFALALTLTASIAAGTVVTGADYDAPAVVAGDAAEADENGFIIEDGVLTGYTGTGGVVTIPDGVKVIANTVFSYNSNIVKVIIPDSVTSISDGNSDVGGNDITRAGAFRSCTNLVSVEGGNKLQQIGSGAFIGCTFLNSFTFGSELVKIGDNAFANCALKKVSIPDSVLQLASGAFNGCSALTEVTLGAGLTSIKDSTFRNTAIRSITIPDTVDSIGKEAFSGCSTLTEIKLSDNLTFIGNSAFKNCSALVNIDLPAKLESIGSEAFYRCTLLNEITIPDKVKVIDTDTFIYCSALKNVVVGNGVTTLKKEAFCACGNLEKITLPVSLENIGKDVFDADGREAYSVVNVKLKDIIYTGTKAQWEALMDAVSGNTTCINPEATVFCTDATINDYAKELTLTPPTKKNYLLNEELDLTGAKLAVKYAGLTPDETVDVTADMCTGFDSKKVGTKTVTVTYKGATATFDVTVSENPVVTIESIFINMLPTKTTYKVGEELDVTGGIIAVNYSDDTAEIVIMTKEMCTGFDSTTEGTKIVTVTYEGKTATFEVTVRNSNIDNEGTVIEVGTGKDCTDLTAALAKINAAAKARSADTAYTLVLTDKAYSEKKALAFPALKVIIKGDEGTEITVPSITAKGDLTFENVTLKTAKGANAAVTAKKALTVTNCTLGTVKAAANLTVTDSAFDALTASGKAGTAATLGGTIVINKALTVSNDLIVTDGADLTVNGKFAAKGAISFGAIKAFTVKNGK